ncbi:MAG: hypothetical protein RLY70_3014 [Planctomycetota bacterium]
MVDNPSTRTRITRRALLEVGGLSTLGLGLPNLLAAEAGHTGESGGGLRNGGLGAGVLGPGGLRGGVARRAKSCIFIYQYGGLSQLDSWDMKPQGPETIRGPYKPIATRVPGYQVGELMPRLATLADQYCVIRSMSHSVPVHDVANRMLLAGQPLPALDAPSFGSIVAKTRPSDAAVPSYVWLQKFGGGAMPPDRTYLTGGWLGAAYSPLLVGAGHDDNLATPGYRVTAFDALGDLPLERLHQRQSLQRTLNTAHGSLDATSVARTFAKHQERAADLVAGPKAREAFNLDRERPETRERYGHNPLGQNLLLARRLIEAGSRLVSVVAWTGLKRDEKFMSVETWDMHGNAGISIFGDGWNGLGFALPRCDAAVATLLEDLRDRGLLESTLVVLVGEFGRTPRISKGGSAIGRDHWPNCYSAMLAGAGIRGGAIYGESDAQAAYVKDKPVSLPDFTATCLSALDIPPETRISPDGFRIRASEGEPIRELFS